MPKKSKPYTDMSASILASDATASAEVSLPADGSSTADGSSPANGSPNYIQKILGSKVYDVAQVTPLKLDPGLSERFDNRVLIKREDLQDVFSFKIRGAYNRIAQLSPEQLKSGVITASAGNHAQGVAVAAKKLGVQAVIVMPKTTPQIKVDSVASHGAEVLLFGDNYDEAQAHMQSLENEYGYTYIPAYDDPDVIAGQGTVAMEILQQHPDNIDAIFIPVGGGGLIAGMSVFIKYLRPEIKVIGVEAEDSACFAAALAANERVVLPEVGIFADGVAVAQVGEETFRVAKNYVDEVVTANTDQMCAAIKDLFQETRTIFEPSGALSLAGMKNYIEREACHGKTFVAIGSGANMNFDRLRHISERTELGEGREAILAVSLPEKPGAMLRFCQCLGNLNISEFNYRYNDDKEAYIFVGLQLKNRAEELPSVIERLEQQGFGVVDMSGNEMAKIHVRHMVGGKAPQVDNEELVRVEFPERPGALVEFLAELGGRWNISLFHYRNHGAAYGRVLVALQVPMDQKSEWAKFLDKMDFVWVDEKDNPAYRVFLGR